MERDASSPLGNLIMQVISSKPLINRSIVADIGTILRGSLKVGYIADYDPSEDMLDISIQSVMLDRSKFSLAEERFVQYLEVDFIDDLSEPVLIQVKDFPISFDCDITPRTVTTCFNAVLYLDERGRIQVRLPND
jgi:hypothetical protein